MDHPKLDLFKATHAVMKAMPENPTMLKQAMEELEKSVASHGINCDTIIGISIDLDESQKLNV